MEPYSTSNLGKEGNENFIPLAKSGNHNTLKKEVLFMKVKNLNKLTNRRTPKSEQETVIIWNELEDEATYFTAIPKEWRRVEKQDIQPFKQTEYERRYKVLKAWIKFKKPGKRRGKSINEILGTSMLEFQTL